MKIHQPGTRIAGRYEVAGRPLMGGMGIVYSRFDHQEQRPVALKTFLPELLPDHAARDRFLREGTLPGSTPGRPPPRHARLRG